MERKKQEEVLNSQKDNWLDFTDLKKIIGWILQTSQTLCLWGFLLYGYLKN